MKPYQRGRITLLKVAVHGITNLLMQLLQILRLCVNRTANGVGSERPVLGFFHDKKNFVHRAFARGPLPSKSLASNQGAGWFAGLPALRGQARSKAISLEK